jgi:uncharacterized protein YndB with AHSA1/START domain
VAPHDGCDRHCAVQHPDRQRRLRRATAIDFAFDVDIARPPQDVFAVVTDPARLSEWQPLVVRVEQLQDGPLRQGSRMREVRRIRGKELAQIVEVAEFEPAERFGLRVVEGPLPVHGDLDFSPRSEGGTRVHVHAYGRARGAMRLLEPVLGLGIKREFRQQYRRLKELLEAETR